MKPGTVPHRFRKWVTGEVLPAIRRTGGYGEQQPQRPEYPPEFTPLIDIPPSRWSLEHWRIYFSALRHYEKVGGTSWSLWIAEYMNGPLPRDRSGKQMAFMLVMPKDEPVVLGPARAGKHRCKARRWTVVARSNRNHRARP